MSTPGKFLNRMFLSVSRFSTRNAVITLCLSACVSLFGFLLAFYSWNSQTSVSGQLHWNHPARQTWENNAAACQSHSDIYFYIHDQNSENIQSVISLLSRFVESKKRLFQGHFSSNDFSLQDEAAFYHVPEETLDTACANLIKCSRITENHWATLDISNYCQWLTLQFKDKPDDENIHEEISRFARSLDSAFKSGLYTPLWNLSLLDHQAISQEEASFGFFAVQLDDLDHEEKKTAIKDLDSLKQQVLLAYPSVSIEMSGVPIDEYQSQAISVKSLIFFILGVVITLSIYLLAGFGSIRFHVALFLALFLGLGGYLGLSTIFMGETTPQTLRISIIFVFLFLTGAIMTIVHLLHNPLEIRSSVQESILRSVEYYIRTAGTGKGITLVALLTVFIIMMYQQTQSLSEIIPENIPAQWLFFAMIAVLVSFFSNLILLPVTLTFLMKTSMIDAKKEVKTDQNSMNGLMLPLWERRILVALVFVASCIGVYQLSKQFPHQETTENQGGVLPFYTSSVLHRDIESLFHVYDVEQVIPNDMASKNKLYHSLRTLLRHVPEAGPEIPVSSPAAFEQAIDALCRELVMDPGTDAMRYSLQDTKQLVSQMSLDLYYRIVSDYQRSAVGDLCQQLQKVKKSLPPESIKLVNNPNIVKRFQNEEKSLLLIPKFSQKELTECCKLLENHVHDITGYSFLKHYTFREMQKSSFIVIAILAGVFVFGFLLFNISLRESVQNIAIFITAIVIFLGMIGFLKIPISNTIYFVVFTQFILISVLTSVMKKFNSPQYSLFFVTRFPTILLITGACIVFTGHLLFVEDEVLLLTGRMIIIGWVAIFLSLYLWFPEDKTENDDLISHEAALELEVVEKTRDIEVEPQEHFSAVEVPIGTAISKDENQQKPSVKVEATDEESQTTESAPENIVITKPKKQENESFVPQKTTFCKVWSVGRKSIIHKAASKNETKNSPVILTMNSKFDQTDPAFKKDVA